MAELSTYTPLKTIVSYALDQCDKSIADFDKFWILAFRGMVDMNLDFAGQPITLRLPVLPDKTVPFPSNCLSWSKVGVVDTEGRINTLKINNSLTTFRDSNPGRLSDLTPDVNTSVGELAIVPFYSNYYYNGEVFNLFGYGNGVITYGECRIDEKHRVVVLSPNFQYDSILFEFIDIPEKNGDYQIFTCLQEALIAFILWKCKLGSREEYFSECVRGRRRLPGKKPILQTINQVIRESEAMKLRS